MNNECKRVVEFGLWTKFSLVEKLTGYLGEFPHRYPVALRCFSANSPFFHFIHVFVFFPIVVYFRVNGNWQKFE